MILETAMLTTRVYPLQKRYRIALLSRYTLNNFPFCRLMSSVQKKTAEKIQQFTHLSSYNTILKITFRGTWGEAIHHLPLIVPICPRDTGCRQNTLP
jgi:hypothetical protein